ncbi:uncharacterized protein [Procambarus clarkii]|uniref:uncharacterized protein n=1 Tax=Procambarus clarkii TaxID=6728 RepID=UPI003744AA1C
MVIYAVGGCGRFPLVILIYITSWSRESVTTVLSKSNMQTTLTVSALLLAVVTGSPLQGSSLQLTNTPTQDTNLAPNYTSDEELDPYLVQDEGREPSLNSGEDGLSHERRKRQTTVSGSANTEHLGGGARRDSASINLGHTVNKHTIQGGLSVDRTKVPGLGSERNVGANWVTSSSPTNRPPSPPVFNTPGVEAADPTILELVSVTRSAGRGDPQRTCK